MLTQAVLCIRVDVVIVNEMGRMSGDSEPIKN
jgi:hypothetical protein